MLYNAPEMLITWKWEVAQLSVIDNETIYTQLSSVKLQNHTLPSRGSNNIVDLYGKKKVIAYYISCIMPQNPELDDDERSLSYSFLTQKQYTCNYSQWGYRTTLYLHVAKTA